MDSISLQKVDLHCHSTHSDGTLTPSEIVELAKRKGIKHLSLTDHDTVSGIEEAVKKGKELGINVIPGIEVTADTSFLGEGRRELHILGYHFNPNSPSMKQLVEFFRNSRIERNRELCFRLEEKGYPINYEKMVKEFGENFGKPNIARVLIDLGHFEEREEAIDFLSSLGVDRKKLDYREVLKLIVESGGIPVIAHPVTMNISYREVYCFLRKAKELGLGGVEVYHYRHGAPDVKILKEISEELSLFITGGSDFHGKNKPCVDLGMLNLTELEISLPLS
jgi:predicted metal-dependent phosphoesterase TrpH